MKMESACSHRGDTTGYFDRVSEQGWHGRLCCHLLGRGDGTKMMAGPLPPVLYYHQGNVLPVAFLSYQGD